MDAAVQPDGAVPAPSPWPRIALVTPILPVPHDATRGRYIHETARALARRVPVRVFLSQPRYPRLPGLAPRSFLQGHVGPGYRLDGIDLDAFTWPALPGLSRIANTRVIARRLLPRIAAFKPDLVLGYWLHPDGAAALACARRLGLPCVLGARGSDIHVRRGLGARQTRRVVQGADLLLTVSQAMARTAAERYGARPAAVRTIVNGFDTAVFHPRERAPLRAALGIAADARLVTYVGRLVESKGLVELVTAIGRRAVRDPSLQLALVGDGVMRERLGPLLEAHGLAGRCLLPGAMEPAGVARWIGASDLLCLPSWSEGYPNVVVEAIACGRPVVATDVGGTREIVDEHSGILVPPRDPAALEAALGQALARRWDHGAIAAAIRRSWDQVGADTLDACRAVLAGGMRTGA